MLVEEAQRPLVAFNALGFSDVQHVFEIQDVRIHVDTIDAVRGAGRNRLQRHVAHVVLNGDLLYISDLAIDVFCSAIVVPTLTHRPLLGAVGRAAMR
ncbi:hypothetical protein D3C78_1791650 [compost metagenome]